MEQSETGGNWELWTMEFGDAARDLKAYRNPPPVTPTGFEALDALKGGGLCPGVHVLMGMPGAGKSALALDVALKVAMGRGRVLYVSAEMGRQQCLARLCSCLAAMGATGADGEPLQGFAWSRWEAMGGACGPGGEDAGTRALAALSKYAPGLVLADGGRAVTVPGLCAVIREAAAMGVSLVVVDYLQRLAWPEGQEPSDQFQAVTRASKAVTAAAKEARVPALCLSSMNRAALKDGKPTMWGGRNSGDIEYDAETVMQLIPADEGAGTSGHRAVDLYVTKNRCGAQTGERPISLDLDGPHCMFSEYA